MSWICCLGASQPALQHDRARVFCGESQSVMFWSGGGKEEQRKRHRFVAHLQELSCAMAKNDQNPLTYQETSCGGTYAQFPESLTSTAAACLPHSSDLALSFFSLRSSSFDKTTPELGVPQRRNKKQNLTRKEVGKFHSIFSQSFCSPPTAFQRRTAAHSKLWVNSGGEKNKLR